MESRAALAGNSVFHNKKISFKLVIPSTRFHTLALEGFFLTNILLTIRGKRYENQINYFP